MNDNELLNFFAGQAMQSMVLVCDNSDADLFDHAVIKELATFSFKIALAMVEESKKHTSKPGQIKRG